MISSVYQPNLSRLFFVYPNFAVVQQYKTRTGSSNIGFIGSVNLQSDITFRKNSKIKLKSKEQKNYN